jgi:C4-dicarboxylate transporter DctM subunit
MSFIGTTMILTVFFTDMPLEMVLSGLFAKLDSFPLEAVLFFILLGNIMNVGRSAGALVDFTAAFVRWIPGGLGIAGVVASAIFGAISGSAAATVVAIGGIAVPAMIKTGYNRGFSIALLTSSGILGIIIPPSILMLLYAVQANVSIAKLFMGGFLPGLLVVSMLSAYTFFVSKKRGYGIGLTEESRPGILAATVNASWALAMPVVVLGGIYGGIFTPTEAAVVGCVYAFLIEYFVYKTLSVKGIFQILTSSGVNTGTLLITLAGATVFSDYLTVKLIPQALSNFFLEQIGSPVLWLVLFNVLFLFLGCWIDPLSAIMIVTPLLIPSALAFNIDPVFLGVLMTVNLGVGYITPPLGANLYISSMVFQEPITNIVRRIVPMAIIWILALIILTMFPAIVTFLPNLLLG